MNPHTFLRSLLLMPLVVPLLVGGLWLALHYASAPISGELSLNAFVVMKSLFFGGVPYLITSALLWFRIGRCRSKKSAIVLIFTAPLMFIPLQALAMLPLPFVLLSAGASLGDKFEEGLMLGLIMALYGFIFGYFYATCAAIIFHGAVRLGLVSGFATVDPLYADKNA